MNAVRLVSTLDMSREEWLEVRREGIGGSDIGAIAGVNPWETPFSVYLRKIGEFPENEDQDNGPLYWGTVLESVVADEYKRRHPEVQVRRVNAVLQHPDVPYFLANVDREIRKVGEKPRLLEIKTSSAWMGGRWNDQIPDYVMTQVQWYCGIGGYEEAVVAVLIGGNDYREIPIKRDDEIIEYLQTIAKRFWEEHVVPKVPPAVEASDDDALARLYPEDNGEEIELPPTAQDLLVAYYTAKDIEADAVAKRKEAEAKLKALLGEHERAVLGDWKIRWPTVTTNRLDAKALKADHPDIYEQYVKTSTYRRFTVMG